MNEGPVSCIPAAGKMSKAKRVVDEARDSQNPELDLADKSVCSFEEMPGLREFLVLVIFCRMKERTGFMESQGITPN